MKNWLICYDIEDDKERRRLYKCLKRYGIPVQKSVFEVSFPDRKQIELDTMLDEIKMIVGDSANIRFYKLNRDAVKNSWTLDNAPVMKRPGAIIL